MGLVIYLVVAAISIVLGMIMAAISFLPYVSYAFFNFVIVFTCSDYGYDIKRPFIVWAMTTAVMCLIHFIGDKFKRLKVSFALLSSVGCTFGVCMVLMLTPLVDDLYKAVGAYVLANICTVFFFIKRTDVTYDDTNNVFFRVVAYLIGITAFAEYGYILFLLWEYYGNPISIEQRNVLTIKAIIGGAIIGCIVIPIIDVIFTKISRKKIRKRQEAAQELKIVFDELGQKLQACIMIKTLTPMQMRILEQNLKEYEDLKQEIDFANAMASQAVLDKFNRVLTTTDDIMMRSLDERVEYEQKTEHEERTTGQQEIREALAVFLFDDISEVTLEKLKTQRNKLIKSFHPDGTNENEKYAQKINAAYELLKNMIR